MEKTLCQNFRDEKQLVCPHISMITHDLLCLKTANIRHEIPKFDKTGFVRRLANNLSIDQALSNHFYGTPIVRYSFHENSALEPDLN
jgi:hypothetical protein